MIIVEKYHEVFYRRLWLACANASRQGRYGYCCEAGRFCLYFFHSQIPGWRIPGMLEHRPVEGSRWGRAFENSSFQSLIFLSCIIKMLAEERLLGFIWRANIWKGSWAKIPSKMRIGFNPSLFFEENTKNTNNKYSKLYYFSKQQQVIWKFFPPSLSSHFLPQMSSVTIWSASFLIAYWQPHSKPT